MQYQFEQPVQALLAVIQARTTIGNDFVSPTFGSAKTLRVISVGDLGRSSGHVWRRGRGTLIWRYCFMVI
jgi:hypothetical protein